MEINIERVTAAINNILKEILNIAFGGTNDRDTTPSEDTNYQEEHENDPAEQA